MMAKPAATKIRLRNKLQDRPPRPDPPLFRHLPPPAPQETRRRRSLRPRRRRQLTEEDSYDFDHEEEEEREQKKIRLVVKLPLSPTVRSRRPVAVSSVSSSSSSPSPSPSPSPSLDPSSSSSYVDYDAPGENGDEEEQSVKPPRKRRIDRCGGVAAPSLSRSGRLEVRKKNAVQRSSGNGSGNFPTSRSRTPMPERKELELILHKLQKNDVYGAFADPVDPEELPDYHDVIEHPMDFATIRKKLAKGAYCFFEQFEDDVLLICSNAMQYNAPDTVYFRHACIIQDVAKKRFQNVRDNMITDSDQLTEEKARVSSMEKKTQLMQCAPKIWRKAVEPLVSDVYYGATLASSTDTYTRRSTVDGIENSVAINGLIGSSCSHGGSKPEKSVVVNELLCGSFVGDSKQDKSLASNGSLDASSLGENKQKSFAINRFLGSSSSPKDNKLEKSVANRLRDPSSSPGESKEEKSAAVNRFLDNSSSPRENKLEKSVNRVVYACSSPGESKQEKSVAISGLLDGSSSLGESKQEKSVAVNGVDASPSPGERRQDKGDDFSAKSSPSKLGRKPTVVDENRRATYNITPEQKTAPESNFVLNVFEDELKQLVPVGLDAEHSYARSLAQFAASLGPLCWEVASQKIEKSLPPGFKFGPGWVGEYEPLPAPFLSAGKYSPQPTDSSSSFPKTCTKDKVSEMKPKEPVTSTAHRNSDASGEQRPRHIGICSATQSKINGTLGQKQCCYFGANNQTSSHKPHIASVRVKEESPSEEITERRQELIRSDNSTHPGTRPKNHGATSTKLPPQPRIVDQSPASKDRHSIFPGMFSRDSSHVQSLKEFRAASSQNLNTAPDNATRVNHSLTFISNNQSGVDYGYTRGGDLDKSTGDCFGLVSFPGKVGSQLSSPMPMVSPLCKENFSPATPAARAWMSVGPSAQWKPVESKNNSAEKASISSPFSHPNWRPPAQFNVDSAKLLLQTEAPQVKNRGLVIFPQLIPSDLSKYRNHPHWHGSSPQPQNKKRDNLPPDLNIGYQPPTSPIHPSNLAMDSQQPDLALQL